MSGPCYSSVNMHWTKLFLFILLFTELVLISLVVGNDGENESNGRRVLRKQVKTKYPTTSSKPSPSTVSPTKPPTRRVSPTKSPKIGPTKFPTKGCPEAHCGTKICMPSTATCCDENVGAFCDSGTCLKRTKMFYDCCAYGICNGNCCMCSPDEQLCGNTCIPKTSTCCENGVTCPTGAACVQTAFSGSSLVCQDCGSRGVCGSDHCCACAGSNTPVCEGFVPQCCKVTTITPHSYTCTELFNTCCPDGNSCWPGYACQALSAQNYTCVQNS